MTSDKPRVSSGSPDIVVPKEKAVFWLDTNGYWRNASGRFRHKKISDHFHAAIRKDAGGFHLYQEREDSTEKVYFPYEDTALFVFDVALDDDVWLTLNTGEKVLLKPQDLFVQNDHLYVTRDGDRIKFSERSLFKMSSLMDSENDVYTIHLYGRKYNIESLASGD